MDTTTTFGVNSKLSCCSCSSPFRPSQHKPALLSCLHLLCEKCGSASSGDHTHVLCPLCNSLSEDLIPFECSDGSTCYDCEDGLSKVCDGCGGAVCDSCSENHVKCGPCANSDDKTPFLGCKAHEQPLELFCLNCHVSICQQCRAGDHNCHQVAQLSDTVSEWRSDLRDMLPVYLGQERTMMDIYSLVDKSMAKLDKRMSRVHEQIESLFNDLQSDLERRRGNLKASVTELVDARKKLFESKADIIGKSLGDLSHVLKIADTLVLCDNDALFAKTFPLVSNKMKGMQVDSSIGSESAELSNMANLSLDVKWDGLTEALDTCIRVEGSPQRMPSSSPSPNEVEAKRARLSLAFPSIKRKLERKQAQVADSAASCYVAAVEATTSENGYLPAKADSQPDTYATPSVSVDISNQSSMMDMCFVCLAPIDLQCCKYCARHFHSNCVPKTSPDVNEFCGLCRPVDEANAKQDYPESLDDADYTISMEMGEESNDAGNLSECVTFMKDYIRQEFPGMSFADAIQHVQCLDELAANFNVSTAAVISGLLSEPDTPYTAPQESTTAYVPVPHMGNALLPLSIYDMGASLLGQPPGNGVTFSHFSRRFHRSKWHDALTPEQEAEIMEMVKDRWGHGHPMTISDLQKYAYEYCESHGVAHTFDHDQKRAPYKWWARFKERNPEVKSFLVQINSKAAAATQQSSVYPTMISSLTPNGSTSEAEGLPRPVSGDEMSELPQSSVIQGTPVPPAPARPLTIPVTELNPGHDSTLLKELLKQIDFLPALPDPIPANGVDGESSGDSQEGHSASSAVPLFAGSPHARLRLSREQERSVLRVIRAQATTRNPLAIRDVRRMLFEVFVRMYGRVPHDFDTAERLSSYSFWSSFKSRNVEIKNLVVHSSTNRCIFDQKERPPNPAGPAAVTTPVEASEGSAAPVEPQAIEVEPEADSPRGEHRGLIGRPRARLSAEQERYLVKQIKARKVVGNPMTINDVRSMIFDFCELNGIPHDFDPEERKATYYFWTNFKLRNPDVKNLTIYPKRI